MSEYEDIEGYVAMFELGLFEEENPACAVLRNDIEMGPVTLAALVIALFETAMNCVEDKDQVEYERQFHEAFKIMLDERFGYDLVKKYPEKD
jgi:uncharacterized phage-like protein YoqJ